MINTEVKVRCSQYFNYAVACSTDYTQNMMSCGFLHHSIENANFLLHLLCAGRFCYILNRSFVKFLNIQPWYGNLFRLQVKGVLFCSLLIFKIFESSVVDHGNLHGFDRVKFITNLLSKFLFLSLLEAHTGWLFYWIVFSDQQENRFHKSSYAAEASHVEQHLKLRSYE